MNGDMMPLPGAERDVQGTDQEMEGVAAARGASALSVRDDVGVRAVVHGPALALSVQAPNGASVPY